MSASVVAVARLSWLEGLRFFQKHYISCLELDFEDAIEARLFKLAEKLN
jgi:hypothetical protein